MDVTWERLKIDGGEGEDERERERKRGNDSKKNLMQGSIVRYW